MSDKTTLYAVSLVVLSLFSFPLTASADAELALEGTTEGDGADDESNGAIGLNIDLGFATVYGFRGWNVFQEDSQLDQNMLLGPGITWTVFDTGLWIGYWGAFQLNGSNVGDNIDSGVGAEQDLLVGYDLPFAEVFTLSLGLAYYFYPFADEDAAGTSVPSYLEPAVGLSIATGIDIGLNMTYFAGLQDAVADYRYLYLNPTLGKSFELHEMVGLDISVGYGYKVYGPDSSMNENLHDVLFTLALPIYLPKGFYVTPSFNVAWTDVRAVRSPSGVEPYLPTGDAEQRTGSVKGKDGFAVWGGLNVGVDF